MAVILAMTAIGAWAVLTDQIAYVVTRGVSMNPVYYEGDLVVLLRADDYQAGQIAAYRSGGSGTEVLHRIVDRSPSGKYTLKGDNNPSMDAVTPTADELIGRAVMHVPKGGFWLKPLLSPTGLGMIGFLIFSGGAASAVTRRQIPRGRRKKKVKAMARQGNAWSVAGDVAKAVQRLSPLLRVAAAAVVVMAAGAVLLGALGWMKPAIDRKATGSGQSVTFSYSAQVPRSAAYDETTVKSPDPIFRKIVNRVDLNMQYSGPPGNVDVSVGLFNDVGWHTTVPLAAPKRFLDRRHNSTVSLDLNALEQRAKDAAKVIGITPGSVSMSVDARIRSVGVPDFTASLPLSLSPLQLILPGGPNSLTVIDQNTRTTAVAREITLLGRPIVTAAAARSWAALLMISALLGGAALFLIARRETPIRTRADIERRFPQLLVQVEPMASPPGKPVVSVDNFPALVKLAERYGQMILTWRRPDADDFVVRDEGITYRYRIPLDEPVLQNIERLNRPAGTGTHRRNASTQVS